VRISAIHLSLVPDHALIAFSLRLQPGDLSFKEGQVILITEKSDSSDTWYVAVFLSGTCCLLNRAARWKGTLDGRSGSFPANFVELA
jgi:SH3 domain-containing YSC84-like protein 1